MEKKLYTKSEAKGYILKPTKEYEVDFDKITSFEDLKMLMSVLFEELRIRVVEESVYWDKLKEYLKEE